MLCTFSLRVCVSVFLCMRKQSEHINVLENQPNTSASNSKIIQHRHQSYISAVDQTGSCYNKHGLNKYTIKQVWATQIRSDTCIVTHTEKNLNTLYTVHLTLQYTQHNRVAFFALVNYSTQCRETRSRGTMPEMFYQYRSSVCGVECDGCGHVLVNCNQTKYKKR